MQVKTKASVGKAHKSIEAPVYKGCEYCRNSSSVTIARLFSVVTYIRERARCRIGHRYFMLWN
jgi:hypothetical protein